MQAGAIEDTIQHFQAMADDSTVLDAAMAAYHCDTVPQVVQLWI